MKIGLVVTGGVDPSGRERVVPSLLWLIERLARTHDVHVFVLRYFDQPRDYPLLGATVHDLGRIDRPPGLRRLRMQRRLAAAVRRHGPFDLLHAYWGMPAGVVATAISDALNLPVIVTLDSGELVRDDEIGYGLQRRWIDRVAIDRMLRRATRVTVTTNVMAAMVAARGITPTVIPIGVACDRFPTAERRDGPPWRLLRVASLNRVKDYPLLLDTVRRLRERETDVALDIVGEDTLGGEIQARSQRLGLDSTVTFHGFLPSDRVAPLYARAHLHVVTSRHEAAGIVVLEAACAGVATIGTPVGYVSDWSPDRAMAVPRNAEALTSGIIDLLHDADRRRRLADAAHAWAMAHDADWTAREFARLYREVRRQRPPAP